MKNILEDFDFGNEAGDDIEPSVLSTYFVEHSIFKKFTDTNNRLLIATAKKGVGKSALIQWLRLSLKESDNSSLIIKCRGAELARDAFNLKNQLSTPNDYIRDWMIRICALVNRELANEIGFAITDDQITLIENAEIQGYKSRNIVGCLLDRFDKILDKGNPKKKEIKDQIAILKRAKNIEVYLLIDDLDATFQNTEGECLSLGTFFSACRYLTQDVKGINFRITMRSDVWPIIRRYDEASDKTEQYMHEIQWNKEDFRKLLFRRIVSQSAADNFVLPERHHNDSDEKYDERVISLIFEPKMPWGDKDVYTYKVIHTLSYFRPRWAIQLCKLAQINASRWKRNKIIKQDIDDVWGEYGKKRISDLVTEHKHQCKSIEELINAFRGSERLMTRDQLCSFIQRHILNHMNVIIEGKERGSSVEIAHFLFRIGFIVARAEEGGKGYEHYHFSDTPDFLSSRTNSDFDVKWEIHPCYREALDITKINRSQRIKRGYHS